MSKKFKSFGIVGNVGKKWMCWKNWENKVIKTIFWNFKSYSYKMKKKVNGGDQEHLVMYTYEWF